MKMKFLAKKMALAKEKMKLLKISIIKIQKKENLINMK